MSNESLDEFAPELYLRRPYSSTAIYGQMKDLDHSTVIRGPLGSMRVPVVLKVAVQQRMAERPGWWRGTSHFGRDAIIHRLHMTDPPEGPSAEIQFLYGAEEFYAAVAEEEYYSSMYTNMEQEMFRARGSLRETLTTKVHEIALLCPRPNWAEKFEHLATHIPR